MTTLGKLQKVDRAGNEAAFDALLTQKDDIESAFGESLRWERLDAKRACRIACYATGSIDDPGDQLEQYRRWGVERLLRFRKVFGPRWPSLVKASS